MLSRETIYQIVILAGAVIAFVAAASVVSSAFRVNGHISPTGGIALVGTMLLFILLLALAGIWLERQEFDGDHA